jgi:hypothetical protein
MNIERVIASQVKLGYLLTLLRRKTELVLLFIGRKVSKVVSLAKIFY